MSETYTINAHVNLPYAVVVEDQEERFLVLNCENQLSAALSAAVRRTLSCCIRRRCLPRLIIGNKKHYGHNGIGKSGECKGKVR